MDFKFSRYLIYSILIIFCFLGCGHDEKYEDSSFTDVSLEFQAAPGITQQVSVSRIELIISSPEMIEPRTISINDINTTERSAKASIRLPLVNNLTFSAKAFQGECPVLKGILENIKLIPNQTSPLVIRLNPVQIIIGVRSSQTQINVGETYNAEVYIEDAPRVYAFTCELGFDENLLTPDSIVSGDFFGNDVLFLEESELPRREQGKIALGVTLKGNSAGVCGSGTLFRLTFRAANSGNARVNIMQNDKLILKTPSPEFSQIENSQISIDAGASVTIK